MGPPAGAVVLDLPEQLLHLIGGGPERRVENPRALESKTRGGGGGLPLHQRAI